ncbi:MAG: hypothetical protein ACQESA_03015 [Patescibacteria group bacterium]
MTNDLDSIEFKSDKGVYGIMWSMMWDEYRRASQIIALIFICLFVIAIIIVPFVIFFLFFLSFFVVLIYISLIGSKAKRRFIKSFAEANDLEYEESASLDSVSGKLFDRGHSRVIYHIVKGYFKDHPVRLFSYRYSIGSGKNRKTYYFTVWEITFEKTEFPHILLQAKNMRKFARSESDEEEINLEGEFDDKFRLYATRGYETEVLQIFTPEFLRMLCNKASNFSIEFAGKSMYIYDDVLVKDNKKLREIYEVARGIFDSTGPLINRLHNDFADMHHYYRK